jgi:hypothetical protein
MSDAKVPQKELEIIWNALQSTKEQLDETMESGDTLREKIKNSWSCPQLRNGETRAKMPREGRRAVCLDSPTP